MELSGLRVSAEVVGAWGVIVLGAMVLGAMVLGTLARRRSRSAVRRALRSTDPEIRRGAVLVASCHGMRRYARPLARSTGSETDPAVLDTLARMVRAALPARRRRRFRRSKLAVWAESYVSSGGAGGEAPDPDRPVPVTVERAIELIDALEIMDELALNGTPIATSTPTAARPVAAGRPRWAPAAPIDALEIVESMARRAPGRRANPRGPRRRVAPAEAWLAGPDEIDALLASDLTGCPCQRPAPTGEAD